MNIVIHGLSNLNGKEQAKIRAALLKGSAVLDSKLFQDRVINAKYTVETRGFTGEQILQMILSGADDQGKTIDGDIDVDISGFYRFGSTIGYTYLGSFRQYINRRWLGGASESDIFGHILHELMHRAYRFTHNKKHTGSVPYVIGEVARKSFRDFYSAMNEASFYGDCSVLDSYLEKGEESKSWVVTIAD